MVVVLGYGKLVKRMVENGLCGDFFLSSFKGVDGSLFSEAGPTCSSNLQIRLVVVMLVVVVVGG
jgi:hypothetical protein